MNDPVMGTDIHIILIPSPSGAVPTPLPHPFTGQLLSGLATKTMINGLPAAVQGSVAQCIPPHIPQGGPFQIPPRNAGEVMMGSVTVYIEGKPAARLGDKVLTCNDPAPLPNGTVTMGSPNVLIGG